VVEVHVSVKVKGTGTASGTEYAAEITPTSIDSLMFAYTAPVLLKKSKKSKKGEDKRGGRKKTRLI